MRVTLDIDAHLLQSLQRLAAEQAAPVEQVILLLIRQGIDQSQPYEIRNGFPVFRVPPGTKTFTSEDVRRALEDEP